MEVQAKGLALLQQLQKQLRTVGDDALVPSYVPLVATRAAQPALRWQIRNHSSGLQEDDVREEICSVMEGGRAAFEERYQRIGRPQRRR